MRMRGLDTENWAQLMHSPPSLPRERPPHRLNPTASMNCWAEVYAGGCDSEGEFYPSLAPPAHPFVLRELSHVPLAQAKNNLESKSVAKVN